jgi:polyisoprenyl-phosphate glycosyltransferase
LAGRAVSGFATVILLQLIVGSLLMISLGIIGEYLARIYEEVKGRPRYLVREAIESNEAIAGPKVSASSQSKED